tara:strand:- start:351 stop:653 length:303 start_codon:yes stop_codon:yes gene_type:complete
MNKKVKNSLQNDMKELVKVVKGIKYELSSRKKKSKDTTEVLTERGARTIVLKWVCSTHNSNKLKCVKLIKDLFGYSLKEAKDICDVEFDKLKTINNKYYE